MTMTPNEFNAMLTAEVCTLAAKTYESQHDEKGLVVVIVANDQEGFFAASGFGQDEKKKLAGMLIDNARKIIESDGGELQVIRGVVRGQG